MRLLSFLLGRMTKKVFFCFFAGGKDQRSWGIFEEVFCCAPKICVSGLKPTERSNLVCIW